MAPLWDDADLMRDALGWLKHHRQEVFRPSRLEAGRSATAIAIDIVDSVHFSANKRRLEPARQYFALLNEALDQIELDQETSRPLGARRTRRKPR
jgi:hypothetical protein